MIQSCSMWARMSRAFSTLPSSGLDSSVSLETTFSFVRFCARMSRGDSFLREAPSFMSLSTDLRDKVSISLSLFRDFGDVLAPLVDSVHFWKASVPLLWSCSLDGQVVKNTECAELLALYLGWLMSHPWPSEVISFRFWRTDSSMPVLPVLSISLSNDNGSKTAKGTFFLISSANL